MSSYPMVEEVNRLVSNALAGGGEVFLPGVGALYTERRGARRISRRRIEPPCRYVSFSSQERGESLVDAIARAAQCDAAQAQEIYGRWLSAVRDGDSLRIEGVGQLKFKNFTLDPAFDKLLNPQGHAVIRVKSKGGDWVLWFGIVAIAVAAVIGGKVFMTLYSEGRLLSSSEMTEQTPAKTAPAVQPVEPVQTPAEEAGPEGEAAADAPTGSTGSTGAEQAGSTASVGSVGSVGSAGSAASTAPTQSTSATPAPAVAAQPAAGTPQAPATFVSGRKYVVLGVFSTPENATRAIADAVSKEAALRCSVYRFGEKYMLSPFDSADAAACTEFIRENEAKFPGMWTYTAR